MTTSVYMLWCTRLVEYESHINLEYYLYCIVWETTRKSKQKTKNLFLGNTGKQQLNPAELIIT